MANNSKDRIEIWHINGGQLYCSLMKKETADRFLNSYQSQFYRSRGEALRAKQETNEQLKKC